MTGPAVFVSAGEPSGDAHAAAFVSALRDLVPGVRLEGVGGPRLAEAGVSLMERIEGLTVMGLVEVVRKIPAHWLLLRRIRARLSRGDLKLVVLVDYPGFHLRVAAAAKRAGVPVLYYIAPTVWAWHESRAERLKRDVSHLAVILPFEEDFFRSRGIAATYVGNPLLDRPGFPARGAARAALGLDADRPVLGLFPGSRLQETERLWPAFREAASLVRSRRPEVQVAVAAVPGSLYPGADGFALVNGRPEECLAASDAALCKSGTITLEAALAGTPQVVAYRLNALSHALARRLVKVDHIALVNLIAGRQVAPEFVQGAATPEALAWAVLPLLDADSDARRAQLEGMTEVRRLLGEPGAARRAAELARDMLAA